MKNPLSSIYEQILLKESEKSKLESPTNDTVGKLAPKQDIFGEKPKPVEGAAKADVDKVQAGPTHKVDVGSTVKPSEVKGSFKGSAPAKDAKPAVKAEEVSDEEAAPKSEVDKEEDKEEKKVKKESFTMNAFETLFKKTLTEEMGEEAPMSEEADELEMVSDEAGGEVEEIEGEDDLDSEEEGDLVADLKELQDKLASILSKLEDAVEEAGEEMGDEEYSDEDFEEEFGSEEESEVKEALEKPKALSHAKGKALTSKKNKVGKVAPKGGKANAGSVKNEPKPKALGDKKAHLQKGQTVSSSITKGDFIK
jgi:hypothetical protein